MTLAAIAGADVGRTAALCPAARRARDPDRGRPSVGRAYVTTATPEAVTAHQTAGMPDEAAKAFQDLTAEYEANETPEAQLAHDADKIETLHPGHRVPGPGRTTPLLAADALAALRTDAGAELAHAVTASGPQWWAAFTASYYELRASTRAHKQQPGNPAQ